MKRKLVIGGNWKMNMGLKETKEYVESFVPLVKDSASTVETIIFPPFPSLAVASELLAGSGVFFGAQNMYYEEKGAFTGEVSASMLVGCGATHVIIGHSERRKIFGETDELISLKVKKASETGLIPILCIGETREERESGKMEEVVRKQLTGSLARTTLAEMENVIIAYEPVWAIGTGLTATPEQAQDAHEFVRSILSDLYSSDLAAKVRIQYGGSVSPGNAKELFNQPDIDGGLVGGASLDPVSFSKIVLCT